jgi:hypothetical protein
MSTKFEFGSWPPDEVDDDAIEAIEQAIQDLAREGLIVDTGQRRWSERTVVTRSCGLPRNLPIGKKS